MKSFVSVAVPLPETITVLSATVEECVPIRTGEYKLSLTRYRIIVRFSLQSPDRVQRRILTEDHLAEPPGEEVHDVSDQVIVVSAAAKHGEAFCNASMRAVAKIFHSLRGKSPGRSYKTDRSYTGLFS